MARKAKTALALGTFDGLHKGHKAVIACALSKKERGLIPLVMLFDAHPLLALTGKAPDMLLQDDLRTEMLENTGAKTEVISFSEIKNFTPEEFFEKIVIKKLNAGFVCCGENYTFGRYGAGTCETLEKLCRKHGIGFECVPLVKYRNSPVNSSRVRKCIQCGNIREANRLLGYEFRYRSVVRSGFQRGRLLGAPTINQYFDEGFCIPKPGVYASVTIIDGREYPSVTNIGYRPTYENNDFRSETCIIGFDGNLYGQNLEVRLLDRIRDEKRFNSDEALSNQIQLDAAESRRIFRRRNRENV